MLSAFYKTHIVLPLPRGLELGSDYSVFPAFFLSAVIFVFLLLYLKNVYTTSYFPSHSTPIHLPFFSLPLQTHNGFFLLESFLSLFCSQSRSLIQTLFFCRSLFYFYLSQTHAHIPISCPSFTAKLHLRQMA